MIAYLNVLPKLLIPIDVEFVLRHGLRWLRLSFLGFLPVHRYLTGYYSFLTSCKVAQTRIFISYQVVLSIQFQSQYRSQGLYTTTVPKECQRFDEYLTTASEKNTFTLPGV